jgi:hypothetical protein
LSDPEPREASPTVNPPPIRYPLPTLVGLALLGLVLWRGAEVARPAWEAIASRVRRLTEGPPVPASDTPQVVAGPIVRRVLLLHGDTIATTRPDGPTSETIRHRGLFDVYDVWPLAGTPSHYRIGNRRPIGWVRAGDVLPWNTRLVVRPTTGSIRLAERPGAGDGRSFRVGPAPIPVIGWDAEAIQLAVWVEERPWSEVAGSGWADGSSTPPESWGVLLSRVELLALIEAMLGPADTARESTIRLGAVLGKLVELSALDGSSVAEARSTLPAGVFDGGGDSRSAKAARLSLLNERWEPVASWGGLEFAVVPLSDLP